MIWINYKKTEILKVLNLSEAHLNCAWFLIIFHCEKMYCVPKVSFFLLHLHLGYLWGSWARFTIVNLHCSLANREGAGPLNGALSAWQANRCSKGAIGWQPEKWSYLKRSRTVINEIIALDTLIHVHALGGDLSSPFDLCVSACIQYAYVRAHACLCVLASNQPLSLIFFPAFSPPSIIFF